MRVSYCHLILEPKNQERAIDSLLQRGLLTASEADSYLGPEFKVGDRECVDLFLQFHEDHVTVTVENLNKERVNYAYMSHTVARVKFMKREVQD